MRRTPIVKIFGAAVSAAALFFVGRILVEGWPQIVDRIETLRWPYLLAGLAAFSGYFILRIQAWRGIVRLFGYDAPFRETGRVWFLSEFRRYVPGSVWSFLGRVEGSQGIGHPPAIVMSGLALEITFLALSSLLASSVFLAGASSLGSFRFALLALIPVLLIVIHPRILRAVFRFAFRLFRREPPLFPAALGDHLSLLGVFLAAWGAYGLGSLVTSAAFGGIPAASTWQIVGAFILSWAVGYLSLVTPMGLGVREGSLILLLTPLTGLALASALAVASRLWLIVTELLWVGVATFWHRIHSAWVSSVVAWMSRNRAGILLAGFITVYVVFFSTFSILRHENLNSGRFDLGIMDQIVWNTSHGRILELTDPYGTESIHRFAIHFDPLLALFAPLYWIWANPNILLIVQSLALGLGAVPVYLLSRSRFNRGLSLAFVSSYLLFPAMQWANMFDFHAVKFATPLLLAAFASAERRAYRSFTVFSILAIMAKEEVSLLVMMIGLWMVIKLKRRYVGWNTVVLAGLLALAIIFILMPAYDVGIAKQGVDYYRQFGDTPSEIVGGILSHPRTVLRTIVSGDTIRYLAELVGPVGFLPIFAPIAFLLAWPEFAINLLSNSSAMKLIFFQYTAGITPFVFISAILGAGFLSRTLGPWWGKHVYATTRVSLEGVFVFFLIVAGFIGSWRLSPLPGTVNDFSRVVAWKNRYVPLIRELRQVIPVDASVSVTNTFGAHFTRRERVYSFPAGAEIADYIIVLEGGVKEIETREAVTRKVAELRQNSQYEVIREVGNVTVFQRASETRGDWSEPSPAIQQGETP